MKPTIVNDRYRLVELVGAGGMATVYRGEDLALERRVAVKYLREPYASDPDARERFLREARSAAKLDHPNIVHLYDVGTDQGDHPFIVMELVPGEDLKTMIRRDAPLPVERALRVAEAIAAGVGAAHRAGIVHCDLKPQNILVTDDGQLKVTDFGIARALQQDEGEAEVLDVVWGSPHYLSPEQARGQVPTPASDVYSIGVMLYEMLTGVPPFHDQDPEVLAMKHVREEPVPLTALNPRIPAGLDWLVRKILSKEPTQRYRNGDQLVMAIQQYLSHGQETTGPSAPVAAAPLVDPGRAVELVPDPLASGRGQASGNQPGGAREGVDTTLWMLLGVAAIAVIGLVPLWLFVYHAYTAPPPSVTPVIDGTPVVVTPGAGTPGAEAQVTVPNLASLSAADAQRLAQSLDLEIEVLGERETTDVRSGAVIEQTPVAGNRVPQGSTVGVVLAAGRALVLPDVIGYDLAEVQEGLESEGLLLSISEVRSAETRGRILEQTPEADAEVRAGDTVTLTVSGGANIPIVLGVNLNNQVILEQAWVSQFSYGAGASVPVTLRWRCLAPFDRSYKVFVHVVTGAGTMVAQQDIVPLNGLRPTTSWAPNEVINDPHQVLLPPEATPGTYQIRVGLYDEIGRLPVVEPGVAQVLDNTIFVTTITVQ
jgi:eukaryotic-like serine/threonine-protein kinase